MRMVRLAAKHQRGRQIMSGIKEKMSRDATGLRDRFKFAFLIIADKLNMNVEIGQHLEEKIAEEAEERRLDSMEYESEGDIEGDAYYMNVTVDFTMAETDNTEVEQKFIDALVEIEGQKAFPCTQCNKICKSKGGLTRHINSKHRDESQSADA